MAMSASEIKRWLDTLGDDTTVAIEEGGTMLIDVEDPDNYLEVGGEPEEE